MFEIRKTPPKRGFHKWGGTALEPVTPLLDSTTAGQLLVLWEAEQWDGKMVGFVIPTAGCGTPHQRN